MHSYPDGDLMFVACCECDRGGNGLDKDKCACGWKVKKWNEAGCYAGILMEKYKVENKKEAVI